VRRLARLAPLVEEDMVRVLLYVSLLGALFVGAVLFAGNAIGAWEPATVPLHAPDASATDTTTAKQGKKGKKGERPANRNKKGR
jgi:hypothetical protein